MAQSILDDIDVVYDEDEQRTNERDETILDIAAPELAETRRAAKRVDITPDVTLIQKSGQTGYRVYESISEFVDNSIDNRVPGEPLLVECFINRDKRTNGRITISDTASGMGEAALEKSMVMAYSNKSGDKIGMFGMGMKTAAANLGRRFTITTAMAKTSYGLQLGYDEERFIAERKWEVAIAKIPKPFAHGTRIDITDLHVHLYGELVNVVSRNLAANFRHFITDGSVTIKVNGAEIRPKDPELMEGYTKRFAFDIDGKSVHGWAGIAVKGSQRGRYGFDLIRNNRIVSRYKMVGFSAHPALAWIRGELHLDDFRVTANKREFVRDTDAWNKLEQRVRDEIKDVVRNSRKRAVKSLPDRENVLAQKFAKEIENVSASSALRSDVRVAVLDAASDQRLDDRVPAVERVSGGNVIPLSQPPAAEDLMEKADRITAEMLGIRVVHESSSLGTRMPYFESTVDEKVDDVVLHVVTNLDHPVYRNINDFDLATRVKENIVEALAIYLCEKNGVDSIEDFINWKSAILKRHAQLKLLQEQTGEAAASTVSG